MNPERWRRLAREESRLSGQRLVVAGVDEAGRGPLAGPVVAAAVVLDLSEDWSGLDDSKLLTAERRDVMYARVLKGARAFAWAVAGPREIDRVNIRRATHGAMARAVARLRLVPELVLVDGHETVTAIAAEQQAVIGGDGRCLSIAAASVLAKVVRDRIMERLDLVWSVSAASLDLRTLVRAGTAAGLTRMPTFTRSIAIRAPVQHVWTIMADVEHWPEWTASMRSVRALGETPPGVGARFRVEQPKLQPAEFTISDWRPPHSFTWKMGTPALSAVAVQTLRPLPEGCELELKLDFFGPLSGVVGVLAGKLTREYMTLEAEGLKRRAEAAR